MQDISLWFRWKFHLFLLKELYKLHTLHHSRDIAGSHFRALSKIPHCCLPWEPGPCLSPSVANHPLRLAKDHRLGVPLPHQLSNLVQAHQSTITDLLRRIFPSCFGRFLHVTHPFATFFKTFDLHVLRLSQAFILSQDQTHLFCLSIILCTKKESFQPQVPLRLPCYDFISVTISTVTNSKELSIFVFIQRCLESSSRLCANLVPIMWRAVCTRLRYKFTVACWSTITSDSNFMFSSCREQSGLRRKLRICSMLPYCFPLCSPL